MKPISNVAIRAIKEALVRLAARPGGRLTVTRLAAEAGVSRATLYRAPELLRRLHDLNAAEGKGPVPAPDRIRELEVLVAEMKGRESDELRTLRAANRHMAQHIQALSLLVRDQQRRIGLLQPEASPSEPLRVVPLAGRDVPR
jgi:DNA-binding transcriptional regulator YhcF (GntR family)